MLTQMNRMEPVVRPGLIFVAIILSVGTLYSVLLIGRELAGGFEFSAPASSAAYLICVGLQVITTALIIALSRREAEQRSKPIAWRKLARPVMALNVTIAALAAFFTLDATVGLGGVVSGLALGEAFRLKAMMTAPRAVAPPFGDAG